MSSQDQELIKISIGGADLSFPAGAEDRAQAAIDGVLALEETIEIEDLVVEGQLETAVAKFDGSPRLVEVLSEDEITVAQRNMSTARILGADAIGAFQPLHFEGGSIVTVDQEGIHIMPERDK